MRRGPLALRVRGWHAPLAVLMSATMVVSGAGTAFGAPRVAHPAPKPKAAPAVHDVKPVATRFARKPADPAPYRATKTAWPAASSAALTLARTAGARAKASGGTVWAQRVTAGQGPDGVQVKVLDHAAAAKAGIDGVLLSVAGDASGPVRVGLDYRGFAQARGGNYGLRMGLASYPACVLTTPDVAGCRVATPLASTNDADTGNVSAALKLASTGAMVLAATAAPVSGANGGSGGTYAATSLSAGGSWSGGGNTGDFTYSYPLAAPSAPSQLTPTAGLNYSSGATDGENATSQPQSSWAGEGWDTPDSFVEQSFQGCAESPEGTAAPSKTNDECYDGAIYSLSLNGSSTALVWDSAKKLFKTETADGSVVRHFCTLPSGESTFTDPTCVAGTSNATDTKFKDWWQITDRDGTTYSFGLNHLPGWATGKTATNSVATVPVYSAHSTDPCYSSSGFSSSVCTVPYRWGLDYVTDLHGNAMSYYYAQDTNFYGAFNGASMKSYVRSQYLDHIDYGFTDGNAYGTVPDSIVFHTGARCVSGTCTPLSASTSANWPDVPFDSVCASGATCTGHSPVFFSTVRLTSIETRQSGVTVDSYSLTQTIPATGDGTSPTLWLSKIQRTAGHSGGTTLSLPAVTFTASPAMDGRLDTTTDGLPAFTKYRMQTITTESGSQINVTYELPKACSASAKPAPATNTSSCYPVSWTPTGFTDPITDWFNKYAVASVVQTDPTGGASAQATSYEYNGGAAWHYDDNELVKAKYRTYGQFRGYGDVVTYTGDGANDPKAKAEATFYRGMSKDNNSTVVNLPDSQGGVHEDVDQLAGKTLESTSYLGSDPNSSTISSYWVSGAAASRSRTGLPDLTSIWVAPAESFTRQALTSTGTTTWRYTETDTSYDTGTGDANFGLATRVYNHTYPVSAAYDSCTTNTYAAANTGENLVGLDGEVETDAVACGGFTEAAKPSAPAGLNTLTAPASVSRPDQVISDSRSFYDDTTFATTFPQASAPTNGDLTMSREASGYSGGAFTWQTSSRAKYDSVGRQTDAYDGLGNDSVTAYTSNSAGLITAMKVTNPLGQATSTTLDPVRGLQLTATDANGVVTTQQYDVLGRLTAVWLDSRTTDTAANYLYTYAVSNSGPTAVTTQTLNESLGYQTSTLIYDGMFRARQTQQMTPQGGRLITDTFYDSRGWVSARYTGWWDQASLPNTTLTSAADLHAQVPTQDVYTYNSLGQVVIDQNEKNGVEVSRTTTADNGDRTTVVPPSGGTVTTTLTDPLGRTSEIDKYLTTPVVTMPSNVFTAPVRISGGTTQVVKYGYDQHGNQNSTTQGTGSGAPVWTQNYNLLGQITSQNDPDAGAGTGMTYDADGNLLQSTDARGKTSSFTYDALGRKTAAYASSVAGQQPGALGNQVGSWVYDNSNAVAGVTHAIGQLTTAIAYSAGNTYTTQQTNFNVFGEPLGTSLTVPAAEGALGGTYLVTHKYAPNTGLATKDTYTAQGGLPAETVNLGYQGVLDLPDRIGGLSGYAETTTYDAYGRVNQQQLGAAPNLSYVTDSYDDNSGRLTDQLVTRQTGSVSKVDEQAFRYDPAGNLTAQVSTRLGAAAPSETQCFRYDGLDQLTSAWTANDDCAAAPGSGNVGDGLGAASAYWTTWTIDALGDRKTQVQHGFTGGPTSDTTTNYNYGNASGGQPHTLTSTSTTGATSSTTSYGYDVAGNMNSRDAAQGNQVISYDDAGRLTAVGGSTYVYDADGGILLQKDPGTTTLYAGSQQFVLTTGTGAVTGTRYYDLPGGGQAIRTGSTNATVTFALADQHGSPTLYMDFAAQNPVWRQYTPYGGTRGPAAAAPDNRGFLNKPTDAATGLTIVGARQYDPDTGRFITDDPVLEKTDPTQLNGYGYAGNNPVVHADPTGLSLMAGGDGGSHAYTYNFPIPGSPGYTAPSTNTGSKGAHQQTAPASSCGGGTNNPPKPKRKHWWQRGADWVDDHQGMIAGAVVGFVAFDACMGSTLGVGSVGCLAAAGAAGKLTSDLVDGNIHSAGDVVNSVGVGMVEGVASPALAALDLANQANAVVNDVKTGDYAGAAGHVTLGALDALAIKGGVKGTGGRAAGLEGAEGGAAAKPSGCSFAAATPVLMADGSTKKIKDVQVGDTVTATDPADGKLVDKTVTYLHDDLDTDMADVAVADAHHKETVIHTTQNHPFWDATTKQWTRADQLHAGDHLKSTTGAPIRVTAVHTFTQLNQRFNLTVADFHTYYVIAGSTSVLVHNCDDMTVYHYTSKDGFNKISSGDPYHFKPGRSKNGAGPFFSTRSPADLTSPNAYKKLGLTSDKSEYVFEVTVPKASMKPLRGGRGQYVLQSPGGIKVPRSQAGYVGPTAGYGVG